MLIQLPLALALAPLQTGMQPLTFSAQSAPDDRAGIERRVDASGHVAVGFVDRKGRPTATVLGGSQSFGAANWSTLGPFGGDVETIAVSPTNPSVVLAGLAPATGSGTLYRSQDAGQSWTEVSGLAGMSVYDLEFTSSGNVAYAGTIDGVWQTSNAGASWVNLPLGIGANDQVREISIDPNNPSTIWVGVDSALGNQTMTLLKSVNGGSTWQSVVPLGGPYSFRGIAIDPTNSNRIVAAWSGGFGGGGVFVSTDGGSSWANRSAGLPGNPMNDVVHDGTRILLCGGQLFGSQDVGLFSSSNDGVTWTELSAGWPNRSITDIELNPSNSAHILCTSQGAGLFESTNAGATWNFSVGGTSGLSSNSVTYAPSDLTRVFIGSASNAIWKSIDSGASYSASSAGIGSLDVHSVASNPLNPMELAIAFQGQNNGGVQVSSDGGVSWSNAAVPGTRFNTVGFDHNGQLYAISDGPTTIGAEGLYRENGGAWTSIGPDQGTVFESRLFALEFDPLDVTGNTIFSGGADFGVAGFEATVWKTTNGGTSWAKAYEGPVNNETVRDLSFSLLGSGTMAACFVDTAASQSGGALRSTNNGQSWSDSSTGLSAGCQGQGLSLNPDGTTLMLGDSQGGVGNGGLFRSIDGGQSWALASVAGANVLVAHDPNAAGELITTHFSAPRVQRSTDGGATQADYSTGIPASAFIRGLHVTASGGRSFVATNQGVYGNENGIGSNYCTTSPNSVGAGALISAGGTTSVQANDLLLLCSGLPANKPGLFFYGAGQTVTPLGNGIRCVAAAGVGLFRYPVVLSTAGGMATFAVDYSAQSSPNGIIQAGSTWNFQFWYRDPVDPPAGFNLSDGLQLTFGS